MENFVKFLFFILLASCSSAKPLSTQQLSSNNYTQKIKVTLLDNKFSTASYTGKELNCFPPITGRDCSKNNLNEYVKNDDLHMELFELKSNISFSEFSKAKDYFNLLAADFSKQRGFQSYLPITRTESSSCSPHYSADTFGTSSGGIYSGTTVISTNDICGYSLTQSYLAFDNKSDLEKGVFRVLDNGKGNIKFVPFVKLYGMDMNGIDLKDFSTFKDMSISGTTGYFTQTTLMHAWNGGYDANGVSADLRAKHHITEVATIQYKDASLNEPPIADDDILKRNKLK